jgi:hypothetical protein
MKLTAEQKAKRLKVKEAIAALDGQFCEWIIGVTAEVEPEIELAPGEPLPDWDSWPDPIPPELVYCAKPALYRRKEPGVLARYGRVRLLCPYHAQFETVAAIQAEEKRQYAALDKANACTRAQIIAIRDGVAA